MSGQATERDTRIDFVRGLAILMMCVDHFEFLSVLLGINGRFKIYTYHSFGWSTAAEFFVFFSGYVLATVYSKTLATPGFFATQARAVHRAWELYVRNALIWALVIAVMFIYFGNNAALMHATDIDKVSEYRDGGITAFMTLRYTPIYFEILPLYMVLVLLAPSFLWLHQRSRFLGIGISAFVWALVQFYPALNFYTDRGLWNFNPFAWQFVFFLGMWFAKECPLVKFNRDNRKWKISLVVLVLVFALILKLTLNSGVTIPGVGSFRLPMDVKPNIEILPLAHFLLVIYLVGLILPSNGWVNERWITRVVAKVGSHSLDCFCLSILSVYVSVGLLAEMERNSLSYLMLALANVAGVTLAAYWFAWWKSAPWKPERVVRAEATTQVDKGAANWKRSALIENQ